MPSASEALAALIHAAQTPAAREALAGELEQLATKLRAMASAQRRQQARPPAVRVGATRSGGRPSQPWVEISRRKRARAYADSVMIRLSTSLYYAAGSPERLDVQQIGADLCLVPARGDAGYKVMINVGGIRINASGARDLIGLADGKYQAEIRSGVVRIGPKIDA